MIFLKCFIGFSKCFFNISNLNAFGETRKLRPVMFDEIDQSEGIQPGEILFVNWESVNKESNVLVRESESFASLYEIARRTQEEYDLPSNVKRHVMNPGKNRIGTLKNKCDYLTKELKSIRPDIVYSLATPKTTIMLCFLSIQRKFTLVVSERNDPNQYPKSDFLKKMRNVAYKIADGVVFQTQDAKNFFCKIKIARPVSIFVKQPL